MDVLKALVLGIVQGVTEFLPVSSSGHIELAQFLMGDTIVGDQGLMMTIVLHVATALSTIVFFRKDIIWILTNAFSRQDSESRYFILYIIISMIPAALVGVFFLDKVEGLFNNNIVLVSCMLLVTGLLLFIADKATYTTKTVKPLSAFVIGIAQAIAIIPGISRSGATISTAVMLGIDRGKAARFSFLMVVPLILAKLAKDVLDGSWGESMISPMVLAVGFVAAFLSGLLACKWMIVLVKQSKLRYFAYYCFFIGLVFLVLNYAL